MGNNSALILGTKRQLKLNNLKSLMLTFDLYPTIRFLTVISCHRSTEGSILTHQILKNLPNTIIVVFLIRFEFLKVVNITDAFRIKHTPLSFSSH